MPDDNTITVDCRGMSCPKPVLETKKAFENLPPGGAIRTLVGNPSAAENVRRAMEKSGGNAVIKADESGNLSVEITKPAGCGLLEEAAETVQPHVVFIASNVMGRGNDELGAILLKAFIGTIKNVAPLPSHIIFVNSGVLITSEDSRLIDTLKELEELGVNILSCGTCLNFYNRMNDLKVGVVSNMYDILNTLTQASKVVAP
jgi:selenium metabolism protein YedF